MACDIGKICRICLTTIDDNAATNADPFMSVFCLDTVLDITLSYMIVTCTSTNVQKTDGLPALVCPNCVVELRNAYTLKLKCEESYRYLKELLKHHNIELQHLVTGEQSVDGTSAPMASEKATQTDAPSLFVCEQCDEKFFTKDELRGHRLKLHQRAESVCKFCSKSYSRLFHLQSHIAAAHPEHGPMPNPNIGGNKCSECGKIFTRHSHLKRHLQNIHNIVERLIKTEAVDVDGYEEGVDGVTEEFAEMADDDDDVDDESVIKFETVEEPLLEVAYGNEGRVVLDEETAAEEPTAPEEPALAVDSAISQHKIVTTADGARRHACEHCDKTFSRATHLKRHMITHFGIKNYECDLCKKSFARPDHLKNHIHSHSENKPHECSDCPRSFSKREQLRRHQDAHHSGRPRNEAKTEICGVCGKGFMSAKYLQVHMRSHSVERTFDCKVCDEKFANKPDLVEHGRTHANQKPFLCSECGQRFVRNDYLVIHMRRHNGEKPYKCKFCNKGFPRATDLNVHEKYHTGEKSHLCMTCGKGFQRAYNLVVHMRVHTGEKPYSCPHCNKAFAQGNDLKAHIRRHTGERYKCEICGEGFIQGYHLTNHKRNRHGIDTKSHIRRVTKFPTSVEQEKQTLLQQRKAQRKRLEQLQQQTTTLETDYQLKDPKIELLLHDTMQHMNETEQSLKSIMEVDLVEAVTATVVDNPNQVLN